MTCTNETHDWKYKTDYFRTCAKCNMKQIMQWIDVPKGVNVRFD